MKPRLFEAVMQDKGTNDGSTRQSYENLKQKMNIHPFMKRYTEMGIKEGLFSDSVGALGKMHDTLVQTAQPNLIGRSIINVLPTSEQMERFPLDADAVAYRYAEGTIARLSGKKSVPSTSILTFLRKLPKNGPKNSPKMLLGMS